jgi:tetratricopeptide (TPR) repeat protein
MIEWLNEAIDWVFTTWRQLQSKDALSLIVSLCSFVIAAAGFIYTVRSKRRDANTAARNDMHSCISEISKIRTEREEKQRELGDEYLASENVRMRTIFNDKTKLFLSKAVLLSTRYRRLDISSFESLLLGAALADEGKYRASLQFYKRAVTTSADSADKAAALRVYGRALIASGYPRWGRWRMRQAAKLFSALSSKRGYDDDKMNYEAADTYARLVRTQLRWNYRKKTAADLIDLRRAIANIRDPRHRQSMQSELDEITRSAAPPAATVPDAVVADPTQGATPGSH